MWAAEVIAQVAHPGSPWRAAVMEAFLTEPIQGESERLRYHAQKVTTRAQLFYF